MHVCGTRPIGTVSTGGARAPPQHLLPSSAREEVPEGIGEQNVLRRESHVLVALRHVRTLAAGWAAQFSERETVNSASNGVFADCRFQTTHPKAGVQGDESTTGTLSPRQLCALPSLIAFQVCKPPVAHSCASALATMC